MLKKMLLTKILLYSTLFLSFSQGVVTDQFGPERSICSGVNIHFTAGHEKDLDMITAAGFRYIRMDFVWHNIEKAKGVYDWSEYDELTANIKKRGIGAIFILDYSNPLYEPEVESKDPITGEAQKGIAAPVHTESIEAFAKWAAAGSERYKDNNIVWEIWNEPNITFWRPVPDIEQYLKLAFTTCRAIRSVDPAAIIIGPATSQIPLPFIETFLESGILEYIDGVSIHPYRDYSRSPETAIEEYQQVWQLIDKYSPAGKDIPVISSEWGYSSATKGVSPDKQAAYIVRMQLSNLLYGVPLSVWYDWKNDGKQPGNFEHNCGTVTYDLEPKPAYIAIKTMNDQLKGFAFQKRIDTGKMEDFIMLFSDSQGNNKIVAWTTHQSHLEAKDKLSPFNKILSVKDWQGNESKVNSEDGIPVIILDAKPQYIVISPDNSF